MKGIFKRQERELMDEILIVARAVKRGEGGRREVRERRRKG